MVTIDVETQKIKKAWWPGQFIKEGWARNRYF